MNKLIFILLSLSLTVACGKKDDKSVSANMRTKTDPQIEATALNMIGFYSESAVTQSLRNDIFGVALEQASLTEVRLSYITRKNGSCFRESFISQASTDMRRLVKGSQFALGYGSAQARCLDNGCNHALVSINGTTSMGQGIVHVILKKGSTEAVHTPTISKSAIFLNTFDLRSGEAACWQSNPASHNVNGTPLNPTNYTPNTDYDPYYDNNYWF